MNYFPLLAAATLDTSNVRCVNEMVYYKSQAFAFCLLKHRQSVANTQCGIVKIN